MSFESVPNVANPDDESSRSHQLSDAEHAREEFESSEDYLKMVNNLQMQFLQEDINWASIYGQDFRENYLPGHTELFKLYKDGKVVEAVAMIRNHYIDNPIIH